MAKSEDSSIANRARPQRIFALIVALFIIPFAIVIYFENSYLGERVAIVRKEKMGHEYLRSLSLFLKHMQQDRGVSGALLSGDPLFEEKLDKVRALLDADVRSLDGIDAKYGKNLRTNEKWSALKRHFEELESGESRLTPEESFNAHTKVIDEILTFIFHLWNTSGLILDPSSDTHYLTSISTVRMPPMTELLGKIRGIGVRVAVRGKISRDEREALLVLSQTVKNEFQTVEKFTNFANEEAPWLQPYLDVALHDAVTATHRFLDKVDESLVRSEDITANAGDYFRGATEAIDANFRLMEAAETMLGVMLSERISQFERARLLIRLAFLFLIMLFVYVIIKFRGSLAKQALAEEGLRESRQRLESITSALGEGILVLDKAERIRFVNPEGERLLGRSSHEVVGENVLEMMRCGCHFKELKALDECHAIRRFLADGEPYCTEEISFVRCDGSFFPGECILTELTENGQKTGVVVAFQDISDRKKTESELKTALREKETLLKEVHHRVKNNLQIISSLFNLQAVDTRHKEVEEILRESQSRIRSMAIVHEKLYKAKDISRIDFGEYVYDLTSYLFRLYRDLAGVIRLKVYVDEFHIGVDTAISLGLIINELVTNSIKYAFPDGREGEITVSLSHGNDSMSVMTIADNGIGFHMGSDWRNTESLGLQIVNTLTEQIGGEVELDVLNGTAFRITFPRKVEQVETVG